MSYTLYIKSWSLVFTTDESQLNRQNLNIYCSFLSLFFFFFDCRGSETGKLNFDSNWCVYSYPATFCRSLTFPVLSTEFWCIHKEVLWQTYCWAYGRLSSQILVSFSVASSWYVRYKFISVSQFLLQLSWCFFQFQKQLDFYILMWIFSWGVLRNILLFTFPLCFMSNNICPSTPKQSFRSSLFWCLFQGCLQVCGCGG